MQVTIPQTFPKLFKEFYNNYEHKDYGIGKYKALLNYSKDMKETLRKNNKDLAIYSKEPAIKNKKDLITNSKELTRKDNKTIKNNTHQSNTQEYTNHITITHTRVFLSPFKAKKLNFTFALGLDDYLDKENITELKIVIKGVHDGGE